MKIITYLSKETDAKVRFAGSAKATRRLIGQQSSLLTHTH
jgi:hypothetical protein